MLDIYILRSLLSYWNKRNGARLWDHTENPRSIVCAKMKLQDTITAKLIDCREHHSWSVPPVSRAIPQSTVQNTVVLVILIDSGGGTVKLMGRFLSEDGGQDAHDVFLIAQEVGTKETFEHFEKLFVDYGEEFKDLFNGSYLVIVICGL